MHRSLYATYSYEYLVLHQSLPRSTVSCCLSSDLELERVLEDGQESLEKLQHPEFDPILVKLPAGFLNNAVATLNDNLVKIKECSELVKTHFEEMEMEINKPKHINFVPKDCTLDNGILLISNHQPLLFKLDLNDNYDTARS